MNGPDRYFRTQVIFVGVPVIIILEGVSTDGRYLGAALVLWTMPMSTMVGF